MMRSLLLLRTFILALCVALCFGATSCGDDSGGAATENVVEPEMSPTPTPDMDLCGNEACDDGEEASCPQDCPMGACPQEQASCLDEFGVEDNSLCGAGTTCEEGCCVAAFACTEDTDCEARAGEDANCPDDRLECRCDVDTGGCFTFVCSSDNDCPEICVDGVCAATPDTAGLVARIISAPGRLAEDERKALLVVAVDPTTGAVVNDAPIAVSTSAADIVAVEGLEVIGGTLPGTATITATVSDNTDDPGDTVEIVNIIAPPDEGVRVTVVEEATGAPVSGATVVHHDSEASGVTDENGQALLAISEFPLNITVMAQEYSFVTLAGVETSDLLIPLPRRVVTKIGLNEEERELVFDDLQNVDVVQGQPDFARVIKPGEVEIALTGFALGSGLLDMNFDLIVGPSIQQFLPANTGLPLPTDDAIDIPGGVTLVFNRQPVVDRFLLVSPPGVRTLWTLGGRVSLIENPNLVSQIISSIDGNVDIGQIVAAILPFFADFYSGITRDIELAATPQLPPRQVPVALNAPTALETIIETPDLPSLGNTRINGVIYLGGAMVPGTGFVPLGITAGLDASAGEEEDGQIDGDPTTSEIDPIILQTSPLHSGLQSAHARYVTIVVGISFDSIGAGGREATTVLITSAEAGQSVPEVLTLPRDEFLPFAGESTFDPGSRTLNIVAENSDLFRSVFDGEEGRKWVVWSSPNTTSITLPNPADSGFDDPSTRNRVRVEILELAEDATDDLDTLSSLRGNNLSDIIGMIAGFSLVELVGAD